jgi:mono/diheme cytochrome c family protein
MKSKLLAAAFFCAGLVCLAGANPVPAPTFNKDVAPIVYSHCASCHRPGEVAPFSLLTYSDAAKHAAQIAAVTHARFMPPWKPVEGFNQFAGDNHLSDTQIDTLMRWAKAGAPEGDPRSAPTAPHFSSDWSLGTPDMVVTVLHPFHIPADGQDIY